MLGFPHCSTLVALSPFSFAPISQSIDALATIHDASPDSAPHFLSPTPPRAPTRESRRRQNRRYGGIQHKQAVADRRPFLTKILLSGYLLPCFPLFISSSNHIIRVSWPACILYSTVSRICIVNHGSVQSFGWQFFFSRVRGTSRHILEP